MLGEGKEIAAASVSALCCERCGWKCILSVPGAAVFESSKEIVFMTLHIGSGSDLHVESSGSSICITVRDS